MCLAFRLAVRGEPVAPVVALVERGLDGERLVTEEGIDSRDRLPGALARRSDPPSP